MFPDFHSICNKHKISITIINTYVTFSNPVSVQDKHPHLLVLSAEGCLMDRNSSHDKRNYWKDCFLKIF